MDLFHLFIFEIPNGYVVELTAKKTSYKGISDSNARKNLQKWNEKNL
jgi:hypothetical protein